MPKHRELATRGDPPSAEIIEKVMMHGDLSPLSPEQRLAYYKSICEMLGINPLTKPFDYLVLDKKLVLYARKDATEQLRKLYNISLKITHRETQDDIYVVTAQASLPNGRVDESIGAVSLMYKPEHGQYSPIKGTSRANAVMKAETKAKRRVTLSICGLGILDETEIETIHAEIVTDEHDQRSPSEIAERNVRQATANATGESLSATIESEGNNQYGPLAITEDNYGELKSHIGQANGNLLGNKIKDVHANVIAWLYNKWRNNLGPSATEQDFRLKAAVEFAFKAQQDKDTRAGDAADVTMDAPKVVNPTGAAVAAARDLRGRIEDLVLTEDQAIKYLRDQGLFAAGWTQLEQAPESLLLYLSTSEGWSAFRKVVESDVKPKQAAPIKAPVKKGRRK